MLFSQAKLVTFDDQLQQNFNDSKSTWRVY